MYDEDNRQPQHSLKNRHNNPIRDLYTQNAKSLDRNAKNH